jgi:hypothetical protein
MNYQRKRKISFTNEIDGFVFEIMFGGQFGVCQKGWEDGLRAALADFII